MEQNHRFRNSDTTLVAFLVTEGYEVLQAEPDSDTLRINFIINAPQDDIKLSQLIGTFYTKTAKVEPQEFSKNYRDLVNMTRQTREGR
jgi:hypothetical protein